MKIKTGLTYCGGDEGLYRKNLIDFYRDSEARMEELRTLAGQDLNRYRIKVHSLKGFARSIGAEELGELAYLQEKAAAENKVTLIEDGLEPLWEQWKLTLKEIEDYIGVENLQEPVEIACEGIRISSEEVTLRIRTIIKSLQNYEPDTATEMLADLLRCELPEDLREKMKAAYREADDFEYNAAIEILSKIS